MKVFVLCFAFLAIANAQEQETTTDEDGNVKVVQIPGGYMAVGQNGNSVFQSTYTSSGSSNPEFSRVASVSNYQIGPDGKRTGGTTILTDDGSKQNTIQYGDQPPKVTNFDEIPEIEFPEIPEIEFPEMPKVQIPKFEMPPIPQFPMPQIPTFNFFPFPGFPLPMVPFRPVQQYPFPNMNFNFPRPNGNGGNFVGSSSSSAVSNNNGKVTGQTTTSQTINGNRQTDTVQFGN